jgi:hypothetical protein
MDKEYFRLVEERGTNSEYYSDDDIANQLQDQIKEEYQTITIKSDNSAKPSIADDEYEELFNSI